MIKNDRVLQSLDTKWKSIKLCQEISSENIQWNQTTTIT